MRSKSPISQNKENISEQTIKLVCTTVTIDSYSFLAWMHFLFLIVDKVEQNTVIYIWPFILIMCVGPIIFFEPGPTFVNLALK